MGTERSTEPLEHPGTLILHQEIPEVSSLQNDFSKKMACAVSAQRRAWHISFPNHLG